MSIVCIGQSAHEHLHGLKAAGSADASGCACCLCRTERSKLKIVSGLHPRRLLHRGPVFAQINLHFPPPLFRVCACALSLVCGIATRRCSADAMLCRRCAPERRISVTNVLDAPLETSSRPHHCGRESAVTRSSSVAISCDQNKCDEQISVTNVLVRRVLALCQ